MPNPITAGSVASLPPVQKSVTHAPKKKNKALKAAKVILNQDNPSWVHALGGEARSVMGIAKPFFKVHETLRRAVASTQFTCALVMPFDFMNLISDVVSLVKEKGFKARLDNTLGVVGNSSQLVDGMMTFTAALVDLEAVSSSVMAWAGPVALVCSLASSVFLFIHGRGLYYNHKLLKELKATNLQEKAKLIEKRSYELSKFCGVDTDKVLKAVKSLKSASKDVQESKLTQLYAALQKRIEHKRISHILGVLITAIGIIASVIFFVTPVVSLVIAASAMLAVLFTLSMSKMGWEIYTNSQFKKKCRVASAA